MPSKLTAHDSGVYRAPADLAAVRSDAAAAGAAWTDVDIAAVSGKAELLGQLARALRLPPAFGQNWDALADSLQDLPVRATGGHVIRFAGAVGAKRALGEDWQTLLEIAQASAAYWRARGKLFIVFIDGAHELPVWT